MKKGLIENLSDQLGKLPGVGRKSAQRLAFHILAMSAPEAKAIADAIYDIKDKARFCTRCFNITDGELCHMCEDKTRDQRVICVVEEPSDLIVVERGGYYKGLYHVIHGALSPIDGISPEDLKLPELVARVKAERPEEVIVATNPNTRGELTAQYIREALDGLGIPVTRLAYGLPMGGDLEFADEVTLRKSIEGRRAL